MLFEEIKINAVLQKTGVEVIESDVGNYLLQLAEESPSHMVIPTFHKNRHQIFHILQQKLSYSGPPIPEAMIRFIRQKIRPAFLNAEMGITGCHFAVAETDTLCLVAEEGNVCMSTTLPKIHIAVRSDEHGAYRPYLGGSGYTQHPISL